jgi:hypothetical protein
VTFARPAGIEERAVCVVNGLTPGPDCPYRRSDLFLVETRQRPVEHEYVRVKTGGVESVVWVPPIELRDWAMERGLLSLDTPQFCHSERRLTGPRRSSGASDSASEESLSCVTQTLRFAQGEGGGDSQVQLTSPDPNTVVVLDPHLPRDAQRIEVSAQVSVDATRVEFMADGQVWATVASASYRAWWAIQPGPHRIQVVAVLRDGTRIASEPVVVEVEVADDAG